MNKNMIFYFTAKGDHLTLTNLKTTAVCGNVNTYLCQFKLSEDWDDFVVFAVFVNGENSYVTVLNDDKECLLPNELLTTDGEKFVGIYATSKTDEDFKRMSSNFVSIEIEEGAYREATMPQIPQKTVWEELVLKCVPQIGDNGNWYLYNIETKNYEDSGVSSLPDDKVLEQKLSNYYTKTEVDEVVTRSITTALNTEV